MVWELCTGYRGWSKCWVEVNERMNIEIVHRPYIHFLVDFSWREGRLTLWIALRNKIFFEGGVIPPIFVPGQDGYNYTLRKPSMLFFLGQLGKCTHAGNLARYRWHVRSQKKGDLFISSFHLWPYQSMGPVPTKHNLTSFDFVQSQTHGYVPTFFLSSLACLSEGLV